jgi:NitT/TauT family transport system permease protein
MMFAGHDSGKTTGMLRRVAGRMGMAPAIVVVLLLFWEFGVRAFEIWSSAIPAPSRVLLEIWRNASQLQHHASVTGLEALTGLLLATGTACALVLLAFRIPRAGHLVISVINFATWVPLMALAPLMVIWFGLGKPPAAAISWLVCLAPMFTGFQAGFASVPAEVVEIMETMGAGAVRLFVRIRLPYCFPFAARAMKSSIAISLTGAVVAEFVGSDAGLGYLMFSAGSKADTTQLFSALSILVLIGLAARGAISLLERKFMGWAAVQAPLGNQASRRAAAGFQRE